MILRGHGLGVLSLTIFFIKFDVYQLLQYHDIRITSYHLNFVNLSTLNLIRTQRGDRFNSGLHFFFFNRLGLDQYTSLQINT